MGGGGAPGVTLPSAAVGLPAPYGPLLRTGAVPVIGRLEHGRCLLDLRTVGVEEEQSVLEAVLAARRSHEDDTSRRHEDGDDAGHRRTAEDDTSHPPTTEDENDHGSERPCM